VTCDSTPASCPNTPATFPPSLPERTPPSSHQDPRIPHHRHRRTSRLRPRLGILQALSIRCRQSKLLNLDFLLQLPGIKSLCLSSPVRTSSAHFFSPRVISLVYTLTTELQPWRSPVSLKARQRIPLQTPFVAPHFCSQATRAVSPAPHTSSPFGSATLPIMALAAKDKTAARTSLQALRPAQTGSTSCRRTPPRQRHATPA